MGVINSDAINWVVEVVPTLDYKIKRMVIEFQTYSFCFSNVFQKGLFNCCPGCIMDGDFCLPKEIDS